MKMSTFNNAWPCIFTHWYRELRSSISSICNTSESYMDKRSRRQRRCYFDLAKGLGTGVGVGITKKLDGLHQPGYLLVDAIYVILNVINKRGQRHQYTMFTNLVELYVADRWDCGGERFTSLKSSRIRAIFHQYRYQPNFHIRLPLTTCRNHFESVNLCCLSP